MAMRSTGRKIESADAAQPVRALFPAGFAAICPYAVALTPKQLKRGDTDERSSRPGTSPPNPAVETLPSGPSRLSPQAIEQNQRQRIIAAAAKAVAAHGYSEMTVAQIAAYARVSRSTFYANFKNRQDCVLRAHRDIVERFVTLLSDACRSQTEWTAKVSASITASLAYMASQPDEACMLTLDSRTADVPLAHQVAACQERFAAMLGSGREDTGSDRSLRRSPSWPWSARSQWSSQIDSSPANQQPWASWRPNSPISPWSLLSAPRRPGGW